MLIKIKWLALNPYNLQLNMYDNLINQKEELGKSYKSENLKEQWDKYILMNIIQKRRSNLMQYFLKLYCNYDLLFSQKYT